MDKGEKIKIVWLCHFSNQEVRDLLPLSKLQFFNFIKKIIGKRKTIYVDFAPWINNLIKEFEKIENVELHIIAPHKGMKKSRTEFQLKGIYYHFFKAELLFPWNKLENIFNKKQQINFSRNRSFIKAFINHIQPDIVNLFGTENPYYSIATLDIKDIPVFVSVQTVYSNPETKKYEYKVETYRVDIEKQIHKKELYYGCAGRKYRDLILENNPNAKIFKMFFPIQVPKKISDVRKKYDFVFFAAAVTQIKGIEDAIDALEIVKKLFPKVLLDVVGSCNPNYKRELQKKIKEKQLDENIVFHDYFPLQTDMHLHIQQSNIALLPIKLDIISGTVVEAMYLELPIVTYKTYGTPYLNKNGDTVLLADIGDIQKLAENMLKLLTDVDFRNELSMKAKIFVETELNNTVNAKRLVEDYKAVINHYYYRTPIPQSLLLDINEFPVY